jgi:hypothetical protein
VTLVAEAALPAAFGCFAGAADSAGAAGLARRAAGLGAGLWIVALGGLFVSSGLGDLGAVGTVAGFAAAPAWERLREGGGRVMGNSCSV